MRGRIILSEESLRIAVRDVRETRADLGALRVVDSRVRGTCCGFGRDGIFDSRLDIDIAIGRVEQFEVWAVVGEAAVWQPGGRVFCSGPGQHDCLICHCIDRVGCDITGGSDRTLRACCAANQRADAQRAPARLADEVDLRSADARSIFVRSAIPERGETESTQMFFAVGFNPYGSKRLGRIVPFRTAWQYVHDRVTSNVLNRFKQLCESSFRDLRQGNGRDTD